MTGGRTWLANAGLALASLAAGAMVAETAARVVVHQAERRAHTTRGSIARYHPRLGWDKPPGVEAWLHRPEYNVHLEINAHGLRGPDRPYEKPPGAHRTLLLGDSFVEGYTVAEADTVRARLESALTGCGVQEVLNGGTLGYSTDQEYLFYGEEGRRYGPDVVALFFFYNDLYYNASPAQGKPYFDLAGDRLVLRNSPVPPPKDGGQIRQPEARVYRVAPWRGSMALRLLSDRTATGNPRLHHFLARLGLVEPLPEEPVPDELWGYGPGHDRGVPDQWRRTQAILAALKSEVEADGGHLAVVYVPDRFELDDRTWELTRARYRLNPRFWSRDKMHDRLREIAGSLGIAFVDPRETLRVSETAGQSGYYPEDGHWNATGHRIAAEVLARRLREEGWLGCR